MRELPHLVPIVLIIVLVLGCAIIGISQYFSIVNFIFHGPQQTTLTVIEEGPDRYYHPSEFLPPACDFYLMDSERDADYNYVMYDASCKWLTAEDILEYCHGDLAAMGYGPDWVIEDEYGNNYVSYKKTHSIKGSACSYIEMNFEADYLKNVTITNSGPC